MRIKMKKKLNVLYQQFRKSVMWYRYLFAKPLSLRAVICRWNGHKCGVVWYNPGGLEPDMHCRNCGDNLN